MFSEKAKKTADSCRFCWMCRHLCPIGLVTGKESNTPRAKGLMVSMMNRGVELEADMTQDMFECCLCNACANNCETGYEPAAYIREARTNGVANGLLPPRIEAVVARALETGDLYDGEESAELRKRIASLPETADVLLYLGGVVRQNSPEIAIAYISLLAKAGVNATVLRREPPSGAELYDLVGETGEVLAAAKACSAAMDGAAKQAIVVLDPSAARMMKQEYPRWNCAPGKEIVTATAYMAGLIREGALRVTKPQTGDVTFHDPCRLARDLEETEPAREIIAAMGLTLREIFLHGELTKCCGGPIVRAHSPALVELTANARLEDAARTGAGTLLCACPSCADILGAAASGALGVEDIFVRLDRCC